jgi:uncharacterized protein (DUF2235 family)
MKRLIVCCDGTWQNLTSEYPTNVVKIAQAIIPTVKESEKEIAQLVFYTEGVGSGKVSDKLLARVDRIIGGAFGSGIDNNIQDAYRFLSLNYSKDDEIYLFGFSRGAYTARSLAGLINCWGGLLPLPNIREAPLVYELYRDRDLTVSEKQALALLPIPHRYYRKVGKEAREDAIEKLWKESKETYKNRRKDLEKGDKEAQQEVIETLNLLLEGDKEKWKEVHATLQTKTDEIDTDLIQFSLKAFFMKKYE